jgi:hypothetical protein
MSMGKTIGSLNYERFGKQKKKKIYKIITSPLLMQLIITGFLVFLIIKLFFDVNSPSNTIINLKLYFFGVGLWVVVFIGVAIFWCCIDYLLHRYHFKKNIIKALK